MYEDRTIQIDADGVTIMRYYFPSGRSKRIAFGEIRGVEVRAAGFMTRWRLWGSTNLRNWLPLDRGRPRKQQLVEFDLGTRIAPSVTPDDPDRVVELVRDRI